MSNDITVPPKHLLVFGIFVIVAFGAALVLTIMAVENAETLKAPIIAFVVLFVALFLMAWKYGNLSDNTARALELCDARAVLQDEFELRKNRARKIELTRDETLERMLEQGSDPKAIQNESTVQWYEVEGAWSDVREIMTLAKSVEIELDGWDDDSPAPVTNEEPQAA